MRVLSDHSTNQTNSQSLYLRVNHGIQPKVKPSTNYLGFPKGDQVENCPSFFFFFPHSVTNRRLGLKTHAQVILFAAWVSMGRPFFSRRFSRFPKENTTFRNGTSKEELLTNTQQFR